MLHSRSGKRAEIVASGTQDKMVLLTQDDGRARGKTYSQAQGLFAAKTFPQGDGRVKLVVDLSTTGPATAIEAARALERRGIQFMDAPVSGGVSGAEKGTLAIMASGSKAQFERAKPLLEVIGRVFLVGDKPGQGQAMKLLNNLLSANAMAATAEVMVLGVKAGLDAEVMLDVLNASSGRNTATTDKFPRSVLDRSFNFGFRTVLLHKDVRLCKEFAEAYRVPFTIGSAVANVWECAAAELGDREFGLEAARARSKNAGLLLAYELSGYDNTQPGRLRWRNRPMHLQPDR